MSSLTNLTIHSNCASTISIPTSIKRLVFVGGGCFPSLLPLTSLQSLHLCQTNNDVVVPTTLRALTCWVNGDIDLSAMKSLTRLELSAKVSNITAVFPTQLKELSVLSFFKSNALVPSALVVFSPPCNVGAVGLELFSTDRRLDCDALLQLPKTLRVVDAMFLGVSRRTLVETLPLVEKERHGFLIEACLAVGENSQ